MKNRKSRIPVRLLMALALAATSLFADGFIVIPRPPAGPGPASPFPLEVVRHDVRVEIDGQLATTIVDQEFYNPNDSRLEGYYLFPLPEGAVIEDFSMWIDGRETRAELLDAAKARGIYEDIVRRLRDPALLEYDGRGVFKMRVFPIEPRPGKGSRSPTTRSWRRATAPSPTCTRWAPRNFRPGPSRRSASSWTSIHRSRWPASIARRTR